jgi:protein TonB
VTSQLLKPGRGKWTSRTTVMAVITAGHVGAIALAFLARGPQPDAAPPVAFSVSLLPEQRDETPAPKLRPPEIVMPEVVVPLVNIDIQAEAPPPPITVVVKAAPPAPHIPPSPTVSKVDNTSPIIATSVEYVRPPVVTYPAAAKQARAMGTAHIRALVETDGHVREVSVERSSGYASLDKAARESVMGALFRPYMHDGVARAALVIVPVDFSLKVRGGRQDKGSPADECGKPHRGDRDRDEHSCRRDRGGSPPQALNQSIAP